MGVIATARVFSAGKDGVQVFRHATAPTATEASILTGSTAFSATSRIGMSALPLVKGLLIRFGKT